MTTFVAWNVQSHTINSVMACVDFMSFVLNNCNDPGVCDLAATCKEVNASVEVERLLRKHMAELRWIQCTNVVHGQQKPYCAKKSAQALAHHNASFYCHEPALHIHLPCSLRSNFREYLVP